VLRLVREHRSFFLAAVVAAFALRLLFFACFPALTDDSRSYADIATNWLNHGIYGQTQGTEIVPTDTRLPGYPAFLAVIFFFFGTGNFRAVMLVQILVDVGACLIIADLALRVASERAARIAFVLAALCPFLANYSAAELTETLEIFFTALALDCAIAALNRIGAPSRTTQPIAIDQTSIKLWSATGAAIAACILLRPDGGILLAAVALYLAYLALKEWLPNTKNCHPERPGPPAGRICREGWGSEGLASWQASARAKHATYSLLLAASIVAVFALAPLVPWTIRNFHTLHHFQPLAPRYGNESDETAPRGFNRWVSTWIVDYVSVEEIYWNVPGAKIDPEKLPSRALDNADLDNADKENANEKDATLALIADYNQDQDLTPELDERFGQLASSRIRAHPLRSCIVLPLLRVADMWLRPRTELLPPDPRWWEFNDDPEHSITAIEFGLLNLAYVGAALFAVIRSSPRTASRKPGIPGPSLCSICPGLRWSGLLLGFVLLRSAFLLTLENPEPRYTLECYPVVIVCAAAYLSGKRAARAI
jgi:hypothetical protein